MKGLRKFIAPFAPDQSGAAAVLCELGGLVIILDAGGCAGNICGFDEPRWFTSRSAIFSAGLRDMDAILGRDDRLVEKISKACEKVNGQFVAVIGTPVPAVIGTDYRALARMIEKKTGLPAVAIDTNGMELYDAGVQKAQKALFEVFAGEEKEGQTREEKRLGILGATPMDFSGDMDKLTAYYREKGWDKITCYGMGAGLAEVKTASRAGKNIVIAPAGLAAARHLEKKYDIPYETDYPVEILSEWKEIGDCMPRWKEKKILIVHQQILANALRDKLEKIPGTMVDVASWFMMEKQWKREQDVHLKEEEQWNELVKEREYDVVIGDGLFQRGLSGFTGQYVKLSHFAVSGKRSE